MDALVAGYEAGRSMKELAAEFAVNRVTVSSHLRRAGTPLPRPGLSAEQTAEALFLYQAGWSSGRVAERFEASAGTILKAMTPLPRLQARARRRRYARSRDPAEPQTLAQHPWLTGREEPRPAGGPSPSRSRGARPLKQAEVEAVVAGFRSGQTMAELAGEFGIDRRTVSRYLHRAGVERRGLTDKQTTAAARLYEAGWSAASADNVLISLRRAGVAIRPRQADQGCPG